MFPSQGQITGQVWNHPPTSKAHEKEKPRDGPVSQFSQEDDYIVGKLQTVNLVTITSKLL